MAVAVAAVASIAPYGIEGFDYFAGMGESNAEGLELFFSDPEAYRRDLREDREKILAATPEQFAEALESILSPVDAEVLTGDLADGSPRPSRSPSPRATRAGGMTERRP